MNLLQCVLLKGWVFYFEITCYQKGNFLSCFYTVKQYDNAVTCGLVWTKNFVAYRCRTCGISPCMSLCYECFHSGNHEGHDFNMFRSQAGGACDCGDINVLNKSGYITLFYLCVTVGL